MSVEVVGWACTDCEANGSTPGEAVTHLKDPAHEGAHTIDFIDADGVVQGRCTVDDELTIVELPAPDQPETTEADEPEDEPFELSPRDTAHLAYIQSVIDELGPDVPIIPCPNCKGQGFKEHAILQAPFAEQCPDCGGWGNVALPSFVPGQTEAMCKTCGGNGWRALAPVVQLPGGQAQVGGPPLPKPPPGYAWTDDGQLMKLPA